MVRGRGCVLAIPFALSFMPGAVVPANGHDRRLTSRTAPRTCASTRGARCSTSRRIGLSSAPVRGRQRNRSIIGTRPTQFLASGRAQHLFRGVGGHGFVGLAFYLGCSSYHWWYRRQHRAEGERCPGSRWAQQYGLMMQVSMSASRSAERSSASCFRRPVLSGRRHAPGEPVVGRSTVAGERRDAGSASTANRDARETDRFMSACARCTLS